MNDEQFQQLAALHSEGGHGMFLTVAMHGLTWAVLGVILIEIQVAVLGLILTAGGLLISVVAMLKVAAKDGSNWAHKIGALIPNWERPMPRDVETLQDMRDEQLQTDGGSD